MTLGWSGMERKRAQRRLDDLWLALEEPEVPEIPGHQVEDLWDPALAPWLESLGWLVPGSPSKRTVCGACEEWCTVEPELRTYADGNRAAVHFCSRGVIRQSPDRLRTWRIDPEGVGRTLRASLGLDGPWREVVPGRVWRLGVLRFPGRAEVFFGLGLSEMPAPHREALLSRLPAGAIVIVPWGCPFEDTRVRFAALRDIFQIGEDGIVLDRDAIEALVPAAPASGRTRTRAVDLPPGIGWENLTIRIVDNENLQVLGAGRMRVCSFEDLGMVDRRRDPPEPNQAWGMLLTLSRDRGTLPSPRGSTDQRRATIKRLRDHLKEAFGLTEDPFHDFEAGVGWKTRFALVDQRSGSP